LGRSGIEVSALGMGTWSLGGPMRGGDQPVGWGPTNDAEATRAIRRAFDLGVTLFDTANVYGLGHSERLLGAAVAGVRDQVVIATKWGGTFDEAAGELLDDDGTPGNVRPSLLGSLGRLGTDYVDLFQFHINDYPPAMAEDLVAVCEQLVAEGLIRTYGWSTDFVERAEVFAKGPHCSVIQHEFNVLSDNQPMLDLCERHDLANLNRGPLAMGLLSDRVTAQTRFAPDTVRGSAPEWLKWFADGRAVPEFLAKRDAVRDILESGGRTVAQGALGYIWARGGRTIPLPGCRTVAQVEESAAALRLGQLSGAQVKEIDQILAR
jgi:aryl-alcohol dehydrogenase-like predicted oxidoreductase